MNQNSFNPSHSHPYPASASSLSTLHRPHTPQHLHCNCHCDLMPFTTTRHPAPSPLPNNHCGHRYCLTPSITSYPRYYHHCPMQPLDTHHHRRWLTFHCRLVPSMLLPPPSTTIATTSDFSLHMSLWERWRVPNDGGIGSGGNYYATVVVMEGAKWQWR